MKILLYTNKYNGKLYDMVAQIKDRINFSYQFLVGSGENYAIGSVEDDDAGLYVCEASNTAGVIDSRNITVDVECKYSCIICKAKHSIHIKKQLTGVHMQNKRL